MKLVDDWRHGLRWRSVHVSLAGIGLSGLSAAALKGISVTVTVLGYIPLVWLPLVFGLVFVLVIAGRFVKQVPKAKPPAAPGDDAQDYCA